MAERGGAAPWSPVFDGWFARCVCREPGERHAAHGPLRRHDRDGHRDDRGPACPCAPLAKGPETEDPSGSITCHVHGGSYADQPADLACQRDLTFERKAHEPTVGSRCCEG